ncbi:MAG: helix-turn-helix transcriptional regulator [Lachnospiraceae bacterium]|nr:helix-turn-helix transcriptional regulator [Lachnospiraceae bacterium]
MQNLKPIIAKNISNLRQKKNMTQSDLADKLNYSDKAVSKWERAESIPDITVLKQIADLFEVTLDYLVSENNNEASFDNVSNLSEAEKPSTSYEESYTGNNNQESDDNSLANPKNRFIYLSSPLRKHGFITGISIILVWLIATLAFVVADIFTNDTIFHWLSFVYAIPASAIVWLVFNSLWFNKRRNYFIISLLMWSSLLSIVLSLLPFGSKMLLILILGIPGQIIIYMWSNLKKKVELTDDI